MNKIVPLVLTPVNSDRTDYTIEDAIRDIGKSSPTTFVFSTKMNLGTQQVAENVDTKKKD